MALSSLNIRTPSPDQSFLAPGLSSSPTRLNLMPRLPLTSELGPGDAVYQQTKKIRSDRVPIFTGVGFQQPTCSGDSSCSIPSSTSNPPSRDTSPRSVHQTPSSSPRTSRPSMLHQILSQQAVQPANHDSDDESEYVSEFSADSPPTTSPPTVRAMDKTASSTRETLEQEPGWVNGLSVNKSSSFEGQRDTPTNATTAERITTCSHNRRVQFGLVSFRLYESTLGDHPWVSIGVPVGLTDNWVQGEELSVAKYEDQKVAKPKNSKMCPQLSAQERMQRCRDHGVDEETLQSAYRTPPVGSPVVSFMSTLFSPVSPTAPTYFPTSTSFYNPSSEVSPQAAHVFMPQPTPSSSWLLLGTNTDGSPKPVIASPSRPFSPGPRFNSPAPAPPALSVPTPTGPAQTEQRTVSSSHSSMPELWLWED